MSQGPMSYNEVIKAAIADMTEHGFDSAERVAYWTDRIREAAERSMRSAAQMEQDLREAMTAVYKRLVENQGVLKHHPGVSRYTVEKLAPKLRADLDRRIRASAALIKLNRQQAIDKTLQRFNGWATSVPDGGSDTVARSEEKVRIRKALASMPFEERRLSIDQGHKLAASINETVAVSAGAIGLIWKSHFRQPGYNYREDHKERDGRFYLLKTSWAKELGLVKLGPDGYYEDITAVAQEPFCRCYAVWIYNLRDVPDECVTEKGRDALAEARAKIAAMA